VTSYPVTSYLLCAKPTSCRAGPRIGAGWTMFSNSFACISYASRKMAALGPARRSLALSTSGVHRTFDQSLTKETSLVYARI